MKSQYKHCLLLWVCHGVLYIIIPRFYKMINLSTLFLEKNVGRILYQLILQKNEFKRMNSAHLLSLAII